MFGIEIDADYLKNEFAFDDNVNDKIQKANLIDAHWSIYGFIQQEMFGKPSLENIADYINNGFYEYVDNLGWTAKIECPIADTNTRIDMLKRAIAKQYIFDSINGKSAMIGGEFSICPDSEILLRNLGFLRKTFMSAN